MQTKYDLSEVKFALKKEISEALNEGVLGAEIEISEMKVNGTYFVMGSAVAILLSYEDNAKWLSQNYEALKNKFDGEWVAILNRTVVDHDVDLEKLVKRLKAHHRERYNQVVVEYVTTKELCHIF